MQLEKDAIMVCHGNNIQIVTMQGNLRQSKKLVSQLHFDFCIDSIGECIEVRLVHFIRIVMSISFSFVCSMFTRQCISIP